MTITEIREILRFFPDDSPFLNRGILGNEQAQSVRDRLAIAYFELNIGWKIAYLYHKTGTPLPAWIENASIRRCYYHVCGVEDVSISEARFLDEGHNNGQSRLLRAMLFDRGSSYGSIADYLKISEEVVRLHGELLFNVHDRLDDPSFVSHHLYPETRAVHLMPDYVQKESAEWIMRRLAYEHGWRAAAQFAGAEPLQDAGQSIDQQTESLERLAIANATLFARAGCLNSKESLGIQHARSFVGMRRKKSGATQPEPEQADWLTELV